MNGTLDHGAVELIKLIMYIAGPALALLACVGMLWILYRGTDLGPYEDPTYVPPHAIKRVHK